MTDPGDFEFDALLSNHDESMIRLNTMEIMDGPIHSLIEPDVRASHIQKGDLFSPNDTVPFSSSFG